jgi:hypothetical protein
LSSHINQLVFLSSSKIQPVSKEEEEGGREKERKRKRQSSYGAHVK